MSGKREQALERLVREIVTHANDYGSATISNASTWTRDARAALDIPPDKPAEPPKPARIFIKLEGGLIQSVFTDQEGPAPDVYSIDYDTDGVDADDPWLVDVPQDDGTTEEAFGQGWGVDRIEADSMADVVRQIDEACGAE